MNLNSSFLTPFKRVKRIPNKTPDGSSSTAQSKKQKKNLFSYKPLFNKMPENDKNDNNNQNKVSIKSYASQSITIKT